MEKKSTIFLLDRLLSLVRLLSSPRSGSSPQFEFGRYGLKCTFCLMENLDSFLFFRILDFSLVRIRTRIEGSYDDKYYIIFLSILFLF